MIEKKYTKIFFRVFPMETMNWDYLKILDDHRTIYIRCLQELSKSKEGVIPTFWTFRSEQVFFNQTQKEIYDVILPDVFENVTQGRDAIVMAYGQTGTGKSLTIGGLENPFDDRGILPRIASDVFAKLKPQTTKTNTRMCIQVSYLEFSKSTINNLLKSYPNAIHSLKEATKTRVKSVTDALKVIFKGEGRKLYSEDGTYPSHVCGSVFTFYFTTKNRDMQDNPVNKCKLHVIDLAGSDTIGNFTCLFKNAHEVGSANLAKTQLEQFFLVLCSDIPEHIKIKQRMNPMIQFLGDSLNKHSILRLVGHIRASREDLLITISMLRFGELIGGLKSTRYEISVDKEISKERVLQLEKELAQIKLQNKYNEILLHQDLTKSLNEERMAHVERTVNEYLQNKITQLTLINVCDVNIALETLKMMCKRCEDEKERLKEVPTSNHKRLSASSQKVLRKSSRGSNKTSSTETLSKKAMEKSRSAPATPSLKTSKDRVSSLHDNLSKARSKASSSSLMKRPSIEKRKSISSTSRDKSKSDDLILIPKVPPEYSEVWDLYVNERNEEYTNLTKLYEKNEAAAKTAYKTYLNELDKLRAVSSKVEKHRNDLMMAKMTRQFQQANKFNETGDICFSDFEKCIMTELEKSEREQTELQELVLKCQTELKAHIATCKDLKKELQSNFETFCKEKYEMPLVGLESAQAASWNIEKALEDEEIMIENETVPENDEQNQYEHFKRLIENEKRKKRLYLMRHREWLTY